jgi:hypothetical protein
VYYHEGGGNEGMGTPDPSYLSAQTAIPLQTHDEMLQTQGEIISPVHHDDPYGAQDAQFPDDPYGAAIKRPPEESKRYFDKYITNDELCYLLTTFMDDFSFQTNIKYLCSSDWTADLWNKYLEFYTKFNVIDTTTGPSPMLSGGNMNMTLADYHKRYYKPYYYMYYTR